MLDELDTRRDRDTEAEVETWRLHRFLELGVTPIADAERLAASKVDLHEFARLVERGCSLRLAAEILL